MRKKITEANDTNEKTTSIWLETNEYNIVNAAMLEKIPERNPSLENEILLSVAKTRMIPQIAAVV